MKELYDKMNVYDVASLLHYAICDGLIVVKDSNDDFFRSGYDHFSVSVHAGEIRIGIIRQEGEDD